LDHHATVVSEVLGHTFTWWLKMLAPVDKRRKTDVFLVDVVSKFPVT